MKRLFIHIAIIVCLLAFSKVSIGQQIQFSQYYSASLHLNPAIAGVYLTPSFHIAYRRQVSVASTNATSDRFINDLSQASLILPVKTKNTRGMPSGGVGFLLYTNGSGPGGSLKTDGFLVNYAHNIQIGRVRGRETVVVSLQGGIEQNRLSLNGLRFGSQNNPYVRGGYDPTLPVPFLNEISESPAYAILNFGAMYYWNIERNFHTYRYSAFSGFSVNNINQPRNSFLGGDISSKVNVIYKYHGGFEFRLNSFDFLPTILGTYENGILRFNAGGTIAYDLQETRRHTTSNTGMKIAFGVWHKFKDSFIFYGGFRSSFINIGLSYDLSTTDVIGGDLVDFGPASEITLQYFFKQRKGKSGRSTNPLF